MNNFLHSMLYLGFNFLSFTSILVSSVDCYHVFGLAKCHGICPFIPAFVSFILEPLANKTLPNLRSLLLLSTIISPSYCWCLCLRCLIHIWFVAKPFPNERRSSRFLELTFHPSKGWNMLPVEDHAQAPLWVSALCLQRSMCSCSCEPHSFALLLSWHCSQCCGPIYNTKQEAAVEDETRRSQILWYFVLVGDVIIGAFWEEVEKKVESELSW